MKRIVTFTAIAVSAVLSTAAMAHGSNVGSGGGVSGYANARGKDAFGFSVQSIDTKTSVGRHGIQTSTKGSSVSLGSVDRGSVSVGGSAHAGSGASGGF